MTILTVGSNGQQYTTIQAAVAAAKDGDLVQVQAGTYVNDFVTTTTKITIQGVGGMVNMVATVPPPNGRAILKSQTDITLDHVDISGAIAPASNNGAGVLHVGGSLSVNASYFHNNQDGVLIGPDVSPIGAVLFLNSEFAFNGITNGLTHNLYVTSATSLVARDDYFHDVTLGHEIKSGATTNLITNNVIADGPNSTASYSIDLFSGGVSTVANNIIEKGANSVNGTFIHLGGDASTRLSIANNTILSDATGVLPVLLRNDSAASVAPTISSNSIYSNLSFTYATGAASVGSNTMLSTETTYSTAHPYLSAAELDFFANPSHTVTTVPSNAVSLFAGFTFSAPYDGQVTVTLSGWNGAVGTVGYVGGDGSIAVTAQANLLTITGAASRIASDFNVGLFQFGMAGDQGSTQVQVTVGDPAVFLDLGTGGAAALETTFTVNLGAPSPQSVVAQIYLDVLGRPADSGGLANWVAAVNQGATYAQVRATLAGSAEGQAALGAVFQGELGRSADGPGLASFTQFLASGGTLAGVRSIVAGSPEAQGDLNAIYRSVLGRAGDAAGLAGFAQFLASGHTLGDVRASLATSAESQANIGALYQAVLGRSADASGLSGFQQYLQNGGALSGVRSILASSGEAQGAISGLYQSILGRDADAAGLANYQQYLQTGGALSGIRTILANSGEASGAISALYQSILGRNADAAGLASFEQYLQTGGTLAGVRSSIATGSEAQAAVSNLYQTVLDRPGDAAGVAAFTQSMANGGSLATVRASLAGSAEAQTDLGNFYSAVLGRAGDAGGLAGFTQSLATNTSLDGVRNLLANSQEGQARVAAVLQSAEGRTPTGAEIVAGQLQLGSGLSLTDLNTQTIHLSSSPNFIAGSGGMLQATAGVDVFTFGPGTFGQNVVGGFDPANDIIQLSRTQFANVNAVLAHETASGGGTLIAFDAGNTILLQGVAPANLLTSDLRFA